jgi:hypothetical protein
VTYLMSGSDAIHFWRLEGLVRVQRIEGRIQIP